MLAACSGGADTSQPKPAADAPAGQTQSGQNGVNGSPTASVAINLSRVDGATDTKDVPLSLAGDWPDWNGRYTGVVFDAGNNHVAIPAPAWPSRMVIGVRRFDAPLVSGAQYQLAVNTSDPKAAVLMFAFNEANAAVAITNADTGQWANWAVAQGDAPLRFYAPPGVKGFYLQIQSAWGAPAATTVAPAFNGESGGTSLAPPPQAVAAAANAGDFRPAAYQSIIFGDEFNGAALDRSKWCTRLDYGGGPALQVPDGHCTKFIGMGVLDFANGFEQQRYRDISTWGEPLHSVGGGTIKLRATKSGTDWYAKYEAAALRSKTTFKPSPGTSFYITARVKLPRVKGTWPAMWLNPSLEPSGIAQWPPEIDILEGPLNEREETEFMLYQNVQGLAAQTDWKYARQYYDVHPDFNTQWSFLTRATSMRDTWMEVGMEWTDQWVCFYVDGVKTSCQSYRWVTDWGTPGNPASLLLNLAIGGPWAGRYGIDDSRFPAVFEVDYVRVYRNY